MCPLTFGTTLQALVPPYTLMNFWNPLTGTSNFRFCILFPWYRLTSPGTLLGLAPPKKKLVVRKGRGRGHYVKISDLPKKCLDNILIK